jgi:Flp pilus assembly protein TadG
MPQLTGDQQRNVILWLSGLYGLLMGMILLFSVELRTGIETWYQMAGILSVIALLVVSCNAGANRYLGNAQTVLRLGTRFWYSFLGALPVLVVIVVGLGMLL